MLCPPVIHAQDDSGPRWIAGDHHIHSRFSVGWDRDQNPPTPILGGDAIYPTPMNALMARYFGLGWMVTTDHGGPNHSQVNLDIAYPELQQSRLVVPEVIQFYGMEFDTPGADHSSLIIPHTDDEAQRLYSIESRFAKRNPGRRIPTGIPEPSDAGACACWRIPGQTTGNCQSSVSVLPTTCATMAWMIRAELRAWNDTAPEVAVGMAGAPGHQAGTLNPDGSPDANGASRWLWSAPHPRRL